MALVMVWSLQSVFFKKNVIHECIEKQRPYMYIKAKWQKNTAS